MGAYGREVPFWKSRTLAVRRPSTLRPYLDVSDTDRFDKRINHASGWDSSIHHLLESSDYEVRSGSSFPNDTCTLPSKAEHSCTHPKTVFESKPVSEDVTTLPAHERQLTLDLSYTMGGHHVQAIDYRASFKGIKDFFKDYFHNKQYLNDMTGAELNTIYDNLTFFQQRMNEKDEKRVLVRWFKNHFSDKRHPTERWSIEALLTESMQGRVSQEEMDLPSREVHRKKMRARLRRVQESAAFLKVVEAISTVCSQQC